MLKPSNIGEFCNILMSNSLRRQFSRLINRTDDFAARNPVVRQLN